MFREGSAAGRIPHVGHGVAVVGVLGLGATAQQVVGEGDVVGDRGVAAAGQAVQVVVGGRDGFAAALAVAREAADGVVAELLVVGGR